MHFAVKTAHEPGGVLNDPLSADILAQALRSNEAADIVNNLLGSERIFGSDLPSCMPFRAELLGRFIELARNPAVGTAEQVRV